MATLTAVYLDLRDLQSARVWSWCRLLGFDAHVEPRPFVMDVDDPWETTAPSFGVELAMLMEHARERSAAQVRAVIDAAFDRLMPDAESAHAELAVWLEVAAAAGLCLAAYDQDRERLLAEVGYYKAEAREDHGVLRAPTLLFDDGTSVYLQLDHHVGSIAEAHRVLADIHQRVDARA